MLSVCRSIPCCTRPGRSATFLHFERVVYSGIARAERVSCYAQGPFSKIVCAFVHHRERRRGGLVGLWRVDFHERAISSDGNLAVGQVDCPKRADNTSRQRGQQLKVRSSKEQKRLARRFGAKQQRAIEGAARREAVRVRKRKQPAGEILHSSERKHQCLLGKGSGGGGKGRGKGGGRGGGFGRGSHGRA